jgi:adenylate kinase
MYHVESLRPKVDNACDQCGSSLVQREDDREEVIRKRLSVYHDQTSPLVQFYQAKKILHSLDASQSPDQVYSRVASLLKMSVAHD